MTPLLAMFSFYDGMSSGQEAPPVVETRYGPALTEGERIKWFSDRSSPVERERKRRDAISRKRRELGIEEDEEEANQEQIVARAKARVDAELRKLEKERQEREELEFIMKLLNED